MQHLEDMGTKGVLAHLRDHRRRIAQPRDRGCDIGRRTACHALKMGHFIQRAALLLGHKIDQQFPDRNHFFHVFPSKTYR